MTVKAVMVDEGLAMKAELTVKGMTVDVVIVDEG